MVLDMVGVTNNSFRRALLAVAGIMVAVMFSSCGEELVFENPFDPDADGSPLGTNITGQYYSYYYDGGLFQTRITFGWDRIDEANSYEYQVVNLYSEDASLAAAFEEVDAGNQSPFLSNTISQTADEFTNPSDNQPTSDGAYAFRVRYAATVTNAGVTVEADSPWGPIRFIEVGVAESYWSSDYYGSNGEWRNWSFDYRDQKRVIRFEPFGFGGSTFTLSIDDEFSGLANGADPYLEVYDADNTYNGPYFSDDGNYNKVSTPLTISIPASERVLLVLRSDNPDYNEFRYRIDY